MIEYIRFNQIKEVSHFSAIKITINISVRCGITISISSEYGFAYIRLGTNQIWKTMKQL